MREGGRGSRTTSGCHERQKPSARSAVPAERDRILKSTAGRPSGGRPTYTSNSEAAKQCCRRVGRAPTRPKHGETKLHSRFLPGSGRDKRRSLNVGTVHGDSWAERRFCGGRAPAHLRSPRNMKTGHEISSARGARPYFNEYCGAPESRQSDLRFEPRSGEAVLRAWGHALTCLIHHDVTSHPRVVSGATRTRRSLNIRTVHGDLCAGRRFCGKGGAPGRLRLPRSTETGHGISSARGERPYSNEYHGKPELRQTDLHFEPRKGGAVLRAYVARARSSDTWCNEVAVASSSREARGPREDV